MRKSTEAILALLFVLAFFVAAYAIEARFFGSGRSIPFYTNTRPMPGDSTPLPR